MAVVLTSRKYSVFRSYTHMGSGWWENSSRKLASRSRALSGARFRSVASRGACLASRAATAFKAAGPITALVLWREAGWRVPLHRRESGRWRGQGWSEGGTGPARADESPVPWGGHLSVRRWRTVKAPD